MSDRDANGAALVTGGARGLGRSYALRLAERGVDVAIADIDLEAYEEYDREAEQVADESVPAEIERRGVRSIGIEADVTDPDQVEAMVETAAEEFGGLDTLITNAGGGVGSVAETRASELDIEHLHATVEQNLYGTIYTCVAAAPYLKDGGGRIVTVASQAGRRASENGGYAHYGAAKAGVIMYTKYLAQDLGEDGVTANVIAPGYIGTGRLMETFEKRGIESIENRTALGRIGTPEDCAAVVEFLVSDAADYVTGAVIPIDAGSVRGI